jgi:hypothetical protein
MDLLGLFLKPLHYVDLASSSDPSCPTSCSLGKPNMEKLSKRISFEIPSNTQSIPGGKIIILGGHSIRCSKRKVYIYMSCSKWFTRYGNFTVRYTLHGTDEQHAISSHELQSALMLTVDSRKCIILGNLYKLCR